VSLLVQFHSGIVCVRGVGAGLLVDDTSSSCDSLPCPHTGILPTEDGPGVVVSSSPCGSLPCPHTGMSAGNGFDDGAVASL
jgi:hypothetical protein